MKRSLDARLDRLERAADLTKAAPFTFRILARDGAGGYIDAQTGSIVEPDGVRMFTLKLGDRDLLGDLLTVKVGADDRSDETSAVKCPPKKERR